MRFGFGRNWQGYAKGVDVSAITEAECSLIAMLGSDGPRGKRFLDVGSGSGLFSLAAIRLGAAQVLSFDYDPDSVACTRSIRERFVPHAKHWMIEQGDALDTAYLSNLGSWDVVYSWGVLHHTGHMWRALENVARLVPPGGKLYIALYNDQGVFSRFWWVVKRFYVGSARWVQRIMEMLFFVVFASMLWALDLARLRNPLRRYDGTGPRGMTLYTDVVDWIGGYPYEVACPGEAIAFMRERGFAVDKFIDVGFRQGCNEFVFIREP